MTDSAARRISCIGRNGILMPFVMLLPALFLLASGTVVAAAPPPATRAQKPKPPPKRDWNLFLLRVQGWYRVSGQTKMRALTPLRTNDRLSLEADTRAELIYRDGRKVAVSGPGILVVTSDGFTKKGTVTVTPLRPVPVAMLKALSGTDRLGGILSRSGASKLAIVSPRNGVRSSDAAGELTWSVPAETPAEVPIEVVLSDSTGVTVLRQVVETPRTTLPIPDGKVVPGSVYNWRISATIPGVLFASDQSSFRVLTGPEAALVAAAEKAAAALTPEGPRDDTRERLLGFTYWQYGLAADALNEFRKAASRTGQSPISPDDMRQLEQAVSP